MFARRDVDQQRFVTQPDYVVLMTMLIRVNVIISQPIKADSFLLIDEPHGIVLKQVPYFHLAQYLTQCTL